MDDYLDSCYADYLDKRQEELDELQIEYERQLEEIGKTFTQDLIDDAVKEAEEEWQEELQERAKEK